MWIVFLTALGAEPDIDGTWVLAEEPQVLEEKHAEALDFGVQQLPWAFRSIARGRLAKPVSNCGTLVLGLDPNEFRATCDDKPEFVQPRAGRTTPFTGKDGKVYDVGLNIEKGQVRLSFNGEDGGQHSQYEVKDEELHLTKQIFSSWLDEPITWTVRYRRK